MTATQLGVAPPEERKHVTVLSATLSGLEELTWTLDVERAQELLEQAIDVTGRAIRRYDGTVSEIGDDGLIALFGAPVAHEDDAVRACYAALGMHQDVDTFRRQLGLNASRIGLHVGLSSGEVVVRAISKDFGRDYVATGAARLLAAKIAQSAEVGQTVMSAETRALAADHIRAELNATVVIAGSPEMPELFDLLGAKAATGLRALTAPAPTRFVGRQAEMSTILRALDDVSDSQSRLVALVGEAGAGKSRLIREVVDRRHSHGWLVVAGAAGLHGSSSPYFAIGELLRAYCEVGSGSGGELVREALTSKVLRLDETLAPGLPALLTLLGLPLDSSEWDALEVFQRQRRMQDTFRQLLVAEARARPVLVIVEDCHWLDLDSQAVLDRVVGSVSKSRIGVLVSCRPQYQHDWASFQSYVHVRIDPLPTEDTERLLNVLLGADPSVSNLKQRLAEQTGGNPFFAEEYIRDLAERGLLAGERGSYRLATSSAEPGMPRSIEAVLAARIDRLTLEQKQVLQSAAVIGKEVPLSILRAIIDLPEDQLYKALDRLQLVELLTERIAFPDSEYIFTHALTHSVANGMLLRSHRRALHARIVDALEAQGIDSAPDHVERLAQHAFEAELWDKAAGYSRRAAANAAQTAAYAASVASLERALLALEQLPHTPEIMRDMIDVRLQLRSSLMPLGRMQETRQYLLGAQSLAEQLSDRERLARVYSYLCQYFTVTFDARAAIEWGERAVELASEAGNLGLQVSSSFLLAETLYSLGEFKRSAALLGQNIQLLEGASTLERFGMTGFPASLSRGLLARCLAELGEFDEAAHWQGDAIRIAREVNQPFTQATVLSSDGFVYVMKGELAPAIVALTEAVEICRTWDLHIPLPPALARLGYARLLSGDNRGGLELLEQAASLAEGLPVLENAAILVWLSSAYKLSGRVDQARLTARRAFELADRSQQRGKRAHSLRSLGGSYAAGTTDELLNAETSYHEALELAIELGMQPLEAHCHFGLGQLYRRLDQPERSDAEFALARELYLKLGMTFWLRHSD